MSDNSNIRVMIVDDEMIMRQGIKFMIDWEKEGYEIVAEAVNGKEALDMIREKAPQIIISDIVMPVFDGVDFAEAVHELYPQIAIIILSGYDNFNYVKQTFMNGVVDYILKPTLSPRVLLDSLKKARQKISGISEISDSNRQDQELVQELEAYLTGKTDVIDKSIHMKLSSAPYYRLTGIQFPDQTREGVNLSSVLRRRLERCMAEENELEIYLLKPDEHIHLLFCYRMSQARKVEKFVNLLEEQLTSLAQGIHIVFSSRFTDVSQIRDVYQKQTLKVLNRVFYFPEHEFIDADRLYEEHKIIRYAPSKVENHEEPLKRFDFTAYNNLVMKKQFRQGMTMLLEYTENSSLSYMEPYQMKNQTKNLIYYILGNLPIDEDEKESYHRQYFRQIDETENEEEFLSTVERIGKEILAIAENGSEGDNQSLNNLLAYIGEHYMEELRLEELAGKLGYNYSYLSAIFNRQMREGFSDYLNHVRIEKACEYLNDRSVAVSHVSELVGYNNHSYFCRVFKKQTGYTPSEYRRRQ